MVQISAYLRERFIAPGIGEFTHAEISDMSKYSAESGHWVSNFFLNSAFGKSFAWPMQAYAFNFIRRAQFAFSEHQNARVSTLAFLADRSHSPNQYVTALFHWESFLGQAWHAYALLLTAWEGKAFEKADGSLHQRLNALYNQMKHVESRISNGQMLDKATVPVWLDNSGLRSVDAELTYLETCTILRELANHADSLMDPGTAAGKYREADA